MWEARQDSSIVKTAQKAAAAAMQAAERAAAAGNHASAENLLREAARLQEASLGPRHPDLANTLNNLGIVCEMTGKPDDAEQYFRRAVSIARTSLAPDHPFVATSQKNLRDFCTARGKKVDLPAPAPEIEKPAPEAELQEPAPEVPKLAQEVELPKPAPEVAVETPAHAGIADPAPEDPEQTSKKFFTRLALGALGPLAMLMVVLAIGLPRLGAPELAVPSRESTNDSTREVAPPPVPAPVEPIAIPEETSAPEETPPTTSTSSEDIEEAATDDSTPASAPVRPVIVRASLCGDLDDWACDPADDPVPAGPVFFYTQIKSPSATTVQHRWYQGSRLLQSVKLRVQANRAAGYRTYSRNVMTSDSVGNWRVEVRGEDGALLHQERFIVR